MLWSCEMPISTGPDIETCMLAESPGPNKSTVTVDPRATVAPVFDAEPEEAVVTPSTCALGGGLDNGAGTTMSAPEADWAGANVMVIGELTGLVLGIGADPEVVLFDPAFAPQPSTASSAKRQIQ
jgi:hypothetical protein